MQFRIWIMSTHVWDSRHWVCIDWSICALWHLITWSDQLSRHLQEVTRALWLRNIFGLVTMSRYWTILNLSMKSWPKLAISWIDSDRSPLVTLVPQAVDHGNPPLILSYMLRNWLLAHDWGRYPFWQGRLLQSTSSTSRRVLCRNVSKCVVLKK